VFTDRGVSAKRADNRPALQRASQAVTDRNGAADLWIAYRGGRRSEVWEDGRGSGRPDLHFVYASGGEGLDRIELDTSGDGRFDRIFEYTAGDLRAESRDTNDDGVLDQFVRFDDQGHVASRETDLDNDGRIDTRATYRGGRLQERTFRDAAFEPEPGDT